MTRYTADEQRCLAFADYHSAHCDRETELHLEGTIVHVRCHRCHALIEISDLDDQEKLGEITVALIENWIGHGRAPLEWYFDGSEKVS